MESPSLRSKMKNKARENSKSKNIIPHTSLRKKVHVYCN